MQLIKLIKSKLMTNLDSILKSRDITLPTKVLLVKTMDCFSSSHVYMWELYYNESWALKLMLLKCDVEEDLRVPWTARRSNQSILKEISLEYSFEGWWWTLNSNTLATWCEEQTHLKRPWCWGRLKVGEGDNRGWDGWMASLTQWTWVWVNSGSWWWTGRPGVL